MISTCVAKIITQIRRLACGNCFLHSYMKFAARLNPPLDNSYDRNRKVEGFVLCETTIVVINVGTIYKFY